MTLESANALATLVTIVGVHSPGNSELPQLDGLVKTATDQVATVGRKGNRVNAVLVAIGIFQTLHQVTGGSVPDTYTLVK